MELPETVSCRNLTARITHSARDGLYHACWNCGDHRGKAASKKFERAKEKALATAFGILTGPARVSVSLEFRRVDEHKTLQARSEHSINPSYFL